MDKLYNILKIAGLIAKEKTDGLSSSEIEVLQKWLSENDSNRAIYKKLQDGGNIINELNEMKRFDSHKAYKTVERIISKERKQRRVLSFIPNYIKYAAAIVLLVLSAYFVAVDIHKPANPVIAENNIVPGNQKAVLITSSDQRIVLDNAASRQIITYESAKIIQKGSTLRYSKTDSVAHSTDMIAYNTLMTPRGGEYTLVLSDGTEVMLNSGSKLNYPVIFKDDSREVSLEGEAFFKVTKSQKVPFMVKANDVNVIVYGTEFNISAYNNENLVQTTLVEGTIGISLNSKTEPMVNIKAGQQFSFDKVAGNGKTKEVNTESFIAWTKGMFVFENEPIENILQVISRWYDFNFEFKNDNLKKQRFTLSLGRYNNVSKILDMVSFSSNLKFLIKGKSIMVYTE
jgi:transmembrane sensor